MARTLNIVTALAAGAALMFYLDPQQGRRRRAMVRDKGASLGNDMKDYADTTRTRLGNRMKSLGARSSLSNDHAAIDDMQLQRDVTAKVESLVSNPMAVVVTLEEGVVRLSGRVPAEESEALLAKIAAMPGVQDIDDQLEDEPSASDGDALDTDMEENRARPDLSA